MRDGLAVAARQWRSLAWFVIGGVLLGVVWRALVPVTVRLGDSDEAAAAVDLTLAGLGLLAGVATAGRLLLRPTAGHPRRSGLGVVGRAVLAVAGSLVGGLVAWPVGDLIGRPGLTAYGVALAWPVGTSLGLFVTAVFPGTARRLNAVT